jgi:hypothetical protein
MRDAGTQCYHSIPSRLSVIIGIIAVVGLTVYVGYIQFQHYKQTEDYCNNKYGFNNWELNETTGTGQYKYYIGQVWGCVPLSNSSSDKSESFNKGYEVNQK